jgi:predicted nucleic acid-binding protein
MISFDTNVLVYAAASISDVKVMRARDLIASAMRAASSVLLLQTLAEFSNVAIRLVLSGGLSPLRELSLAPSAGGPH